MWCPVLLFIFLFFLNRLKIVQCPAVIVSLFCLFSCFYQNYYCCRAIQYFCGYFCCCVAKMCCARMLLLLIYDVNTNNWNWTRTNFLDIHMKTCIPIKIKRNSRFIDNIYLIENYTIKKQLTWNNLKLKILILYLLYIMKSIF